VPSASRSKKERAAERRAKVESLQREQRDRERRRTILGASAVVVILLAIAGGVFFSLHHQSSPTANDAQQVMPAPVSGATTTQVTPQQVKNPTSINGVLAWDTGGYPPDAGGKPGPHAISHDHVTGPVTYAVTPPVGGPHNAVWMNAGVYTKPLPNERAVHNLEHGAVWITYRPDLPQSDIDQLVSLFDKQTMIPEAQDGGRSNRYMDVSPWADNSLPAPVVVSSWGYQLRVQSPTDPRIQQFIDTFRHSPKYTPEYGSPVDGVPVQTGGNPAVNGSSKANL
jgi:hypothetical protein